MSDRDIVLGKIRRALTADGTDMGRRAVTIARLEGLPRGVIPARGQKARYDKIKLFIDMAERAAATVDHVENRDQVPATVADYLRQNNLPATLRMGDDLLLNGLPWSKTQIEVSHGPSDGSDPVGMSHALAGVAESGTLVLTSGNDNPTTLNFLPETHVVVVRGDDIAGDYESVWDVIRKKHGPGQMPRTVNFVTGPSRSADIEQKLLLGAHGPRRLHIVVVG